VCPYCRSNAENLCDAPVFTGYTRDGGYATHAVADARYCFPLGEAGDDAEIAPWLCAGLIGWRSYRMAGEGATLGLYGFGASALQAIQVARHWGCEVHVASRSQSDLERAEALLARSLEEAEAMDDPWAIVRTLLFTGWIPWTRRHYGEAEPIWHRALEIAREHGDRWAEVRALTALSINRENMDAYEEAKALIDEAARIAEEMDDLFSVAVARVQHARLHEDEEEYEEALPDFEHAIAVFSDLGARWELGDALAERGIVLRELGRLDEAEDALRQAIRISEELGERQLASWTWRALARVAEKRGDRAAADERFRRAAQAEAERLR